MPRPSVVAVTIAAALAYATVAAGQWRVQPSGSTASLRGVSAVNERVVWASGSAGTVLRTVDGGRSWRRIPPPPGSDSLDFRDVHAVSATTAYVMSAGDSGQSRIYKTTSGGGRWALQYTSDQPGFFLDAIAFWDARRGVAMSDPVAGRFVVLTTSDGGGTWTPVPAAQMPAAIEGEAAFAAGGTALTVRAGGHAWFGTGGSGATRVFRSTDFGRRWHAAPAPLATGAASQGIFAVAFRDAQRGVAVGGDYANPASGNDVAATTADGGRSWRALTDRAPTGYRSGLAVVPGTRGRVVIAVGTSGSDRSTDGGLTWAPLDTLGFNAVSFASPAAGWAVGAGGRIARYVPRATAARGASSDTRQATAR